MTVAQLQAPIAPTVPAFLTLVTLTNRHGHEVSVTVGTATDRCAEIFRAVAEEKAKRGLIGYSILEMLEIEGCPF